MITLRQITAPLLLALLVSGCASMRTAEWYDHWSKCALAGGMAGGAVGVIADDSDAALTGVVGGAILGGLVCAIRDHQAASAMHDGDADRDGVVDSMDRCPGTRPGVAVDNNGCKLAQHFRLDGVNFFHDSARLTDSSRAILDSAVRILLRHPDLSVEVAGHTDSQGTQEYNLDLSLRRAHAVRDYLVNRGANPDRVTARGYGETQPIADNGSPGGRAMNRRVELRQF